MKKTKIGIAIATLILCLASVFATAGITHGVSTFVLNGQKYTAQYDILDGITSKEYLRSMNPIGNTCDKSIVTDGKKITVNQGCIAVIPQISLVKDFEQHKLTVTGDGLVPFVIDYTLN